MKMKKSVCLFIALAIFSSCVKESVPGSSRLIGIKVADIIRTKASPDLRCEEKLLMSVPVEVSDSGEDIYLEAWISENAVPLATKGAPIDDDPDSPNHIALKYGKFFTSAYYNGEKYVDEIGEAGEMSDVPVTYGEGIWNFAENYYWPDEGDLTFFSYAPEGSLAADDYSFNPSIGAEFSYSLPEHTDANADAVNQKDLLIGLDTENRTQDNAYASINFFHALTAVKFLNNDIKGIKVKSVTLKNFYGSGTATVTKDKDGAKFIWAIPEGTELSSYTQDFGTEFDSDGDNQNNNKSFDLSEDESFTFMMVPQKLDPSAQIIIELDRTIHSKVVLNIGQIDKDDFWSPSDETNREKEAAQLKDWSGYAGKTITFRVGLKSYHTISIDVSGDASEGITITNNGLDPVYVRASLVINFENERNEIISTVKGGSSYVSYSIGDSEKWELKSDGYWYSKEPVPINGTLSFISGLSWNEKPQKIHEFEDSREKVITRTIDHMDANVLVQGVISKPNGWQ